MTGRTSAPAFVKALLVVSIAAVAAPAAAEESPELRWNSVSTNPAGAALGGLTVTYSRAVLRRMSIDVSMLYTAPLLVDAHTLGGEVGLTYWSGGPFSGLFVTLYLQASYTIPAEDTVLSVLAITPGVMFGWGWLFRSGFSIALGGGFGWASAAWEEECPAGTSCAAVGAGPTPRAVVTFGYAF